MSPLRVEYVRLRRFTHAGLRRAIRKRSERGYVLLAMDPRFEHPWWTRRWTASLVKATPPGNRE